MSEHILTETQGGVLAIEIRRPERRNALTVAMYAALAAAVRQGEADRSVRALLNRGQPGSFTAGNDVRDFLESPPRDLEAPVFQFLRTLIHADKPVVAAVSGDAVGIGTTMLLHCDFVVAAESARFTVPFVNLGVCPEAASSVALAWVVGGRHATEMLMTGEPVDARRAHEWGLVNRVVPEAELAEAAQRALASFVAKPAEALRATKALLKRNLRPLYDEALAVEAAQFGRLLASDDSREAFRAFLEKRAPRFAGTA